MELLSTAIVKLSDNIRFQEEPTWSSITIIKLDVMWQVMHASSDH